MNPDVRFLFQRLHLVMDLMNSGWPSRTYPGIPPAAVENGEEQPCMGCSRGVGGVPLLRWAGRSGRGDIAGTPATLQLTEAGGALHGVIDAGGYRYRSEEHTAELQSLMRLSSAVCCL